MFEAMAVFTCGVVKVGDQLLAQRLFDFFPMLCEVPGHICFESLLEFGQSGRVGLVEKFFCGLLLKGFKRLIGA